MGKDVSRGGFKLRTIFGDFSTVESLAKFFDKSLSTVFLVYSGWYFGGGLFSSLFFHKKV